MAIIEVVDICLFNRSVLWSQLINKRYFYYVLNKHILKQSIARIALVVDDYDKAIEFYTKKLDFLLVEDTNLGDGKRWVIVSPKGANECSLVLAKADDEDQESRVGNQTGGRVFLFLYTDNFWRDYYKMVEKGVKFFREPEKMPYGMVAVFKDLYGNMWDLLEPVTEK
tara:strand:- start:288 stop:791 length:504 start_codon:yes stop_codon:yes gene_type:complete